MKKYNIKLEDVITYENYYKSLRKCNRDVNYKYSVQEYNSDCLLNIAKTINHIKSGKVPKIKNVRKVKIYERGKERVICPIDISDRITQKVICDNVLIPSIMPHLIYDNGASVKYKGTSFSRNRANQFFEKAKREYGDDNVYALVFDFKSYFDSIPHKSCLNVLQKYVQDERLVNLTIGIIESYALSEIEGIKDPAEREEERRKILNHEYCGICLGSQISQIMAVSVPNDFDHYIKDFLRMKYYVRHMDDGIILFNDKEKLKEIKNLLAEKLKECGLQFNDKKTRIVNLKDGLTFLKIKYQFINGKIVKRLVRSGISRQRRKLKKFMPFVEEGKMTLDDVYMSMQSWNAHSKAANSYKTTKNMFKQYDKLYNGYKLTMNYFKSHPDVSRKKKVVKV